MPGRTTPGPGFTCTTCRPRLLCTRRYLVPDADDGAMAERTDLASKPSGLLARVFRATFCARLGTGALVRVGALHRRVRVRGVRPQWHQVSHLPTVPVAREVPRPQAEHPTRRPSALVPRGTSTLFICVSHSLSRRDACSVSLRSEMGSELAQVPHLDL